MINHEQEKVICEHKKNILLLATAGTGKTNTLAQRISKIISSGLANSDEILCITFTNKACKEMKDRIAAMNDGPQNVEVRTFHSLCYEIIKLEAKKNTDVSTNFIIYDEDDSLNAVREISTISLDLKDTKSIIDFIKNSRLSFGYITGSLKRDLNKTMKRIKEDEIYLNSFLGKFKKKKPLVREALLNHGSELVQDYTTKLKEYKALDFTDLITNTVLLFENEDVVSQIAAKYKYINIDEIQDTSVIEYNLIEKIFKNNNILLCGDIFQTIYEWRGSAPYEIIGMFKEKYNPEIISFNKNYRATKRLTECATSYLYKAFPKEVSSILQEGLSSDSQTVGNKIKFHTSGNAKQEAQWIFNQISQLPQGDRKKACILTRNNNYNVSLSKELREISNGTLDFALIDDTRFFRKKEVKDVIAFLKLAINHYDGTALKRIIRLIPCNIKEETIKKIESEKFKNAGVSITDFIDKEAMANNDKYALLEKELIKGNVVVFDVESTGTDTSRDEIIQIAAVRVNEKGEELDRFVKFLKPSKTVGLSENVHGFSDDFLDKEGEDKKKTIESFKDFIEGRVLVGHNVQYDINILKSEVKRNNVEDVNFKCFFDTLDIYRRFCPNMGNHKLCNISLMVNTINKPNHDALCDILATAEVLIYALNNFINPTRDKRISYMKKISDEFIGLSKELNAFFSYTEDKRPTEIIKHVVNEFKLLDIYGSKSEEADNLRDFYFTAKSEEDKELHFRDCLVDFVTITTLSDGEMEKLFLRKGKIPIITIHQAKGLEFDYIFLAGLQDNVFPNAISIKEDSLEEEKRVFYVALTRAKKELFISYAVYGRGKAQNKSRLLYLLDDKHLIRA